MAGLCTFVFLKVRIKCNAKEEKLGPQCVGPAKSSLRLPPLLHEEGTRIHMRSSNILIMKCYCFAPPLVGVDDNELATFA